MEEKEKSLHHIFIEQTESAALAYIPTFPLEDFSVPNFDSAH